MIQLKATVEILDEIPYILLVPKFEVGYHNFYLHDLLLFLEQNFSIKTIGLQSPFYFKVLEQDFIIALKRNPTDDQFCALKILFKSFLDKDIDYKLEVLYALQKKFNLELFNGKDNGHLADASYNLRMHITDMQKVKTEEFLSGFCPEALLN